MRCSVEVFPQAPPDLFVSPLLAHGVGVSIGMSGMRVGEGDGFSVEDGKETIGVSPGMGDVIEMKVGLAVGVGVCVTGVGDDVAVSVAVGVSVGDDPVRKEMPPSAIRMAIIATTTTDAATAMFVVGTQGGGVNLTVFRIAPQLLQVLAPGGLLYPHDGQTEDCVSDGGCPILSRLCFISSAV